MHASQARPLVGLVTSAVCVLLVTGLVTFAGPCVHADGTTGTCVWAQHAALGSSAVCLVLSLVRVFELDEGERRGLDVGIALTGALVALTPGLVCGLCADEAMRCHALMAPFVRVCGAIVGLVALVDLVMRLVAIARR